MQIHIIDVGCGNMAIILNPDGTKVVIDCKLTSDNIADVLSYTQQILGKDSSIDVFINSHRDSDHMRGIIDLHMQHPIRAIWDADVPGTTIDSTEYSAYMRLRRRLPAKTIKAQNYYTFGNAKYRCMNAKQDDYTDPNQQSVVLKIEYKVPSCSVLFAGDTDYRPWKEKILTSYNDADIHSALLVAAHHGSITFFDDPSDEKHYYVDHIKKIEPAMTLISVGPNQYGLPDAKATEIYKKYSTGSNKDNKVYTTQDMHNMMITLKDDGGWSLNVNQ
jgi:beta-lactamase superfamily II metal-dependent hydrolase